jgi:hypothetical protein
VSGAARVRPNPPPLYLGCEVWRRGKFVGNVVCSAPSIWWKGEEFLPFRRIEGYEIRVIVTGGHPLRKLCTRLRKVSQCHHPSK